MHRFAIRVRYGDTDQMGFAYYGNYLRWFEIGRAEMLRSLGRSYRDIESLGIWLPVLEAKCRYLKPARYDDEVVIETGVLALGRASVRFGYRVVRGGSEASSDGNAASSGGSEASSGGNTASSGGNAASSARDAEMLAFGHTEHCYMGPGERPVRPPRELLELLATAPPAVLPGPD